MYERLPGVHGTYLEKLVDSIYVDSDATPTAKPFFTKGDDGSDVPTFRRHYLNMRNQRHTREDYVQGIFTHGLLRDKRGPPVLVEGDEEVNGVRQERLPLKCMTRHCLQTRLKCQPRLSDSTAHPS